MEQANTTAEQYNKTIERKNAWMTSYRRTVDQLIYKLEEFRMKDTYRELNSPSIITMFKSAMMEIERLQREFNLKLDEIESLEERIEDLLINAGENEK